jgi:hypothetical protein
MRIRLAARYEFYPTGINGTAWRQRRGSLTTGRYFSALHRLWPVFCDNLEQIVTDEQRQEELAYQFDLNLNEIRNGGAGATEIRVLRVACAERLHLINQLHQAAHERLELIERQQAELVAKDALIKKLGSTHPGAWLYRLLPRRLRQFLKRQVEAL